MDHPNLEQQLRELKQKKKELVQKFTRQSVDAINLCEQANLTHMSIADSKCDLELKLKRKKTKIKIKVQAEDKLEN